MFDVKALIVIWCKIKRQHFSLEFITHFKTKYGLIGLALIS